MGDLIENLIMNAKTIYSLYQKIRVEKDEEERNNWFDYLKICKRNEERFLDKLVLFYHGYLPDILFQFRETYGIEEMVLLENYLVFSSPSLPILRVFEKLKKLIKENPIVLSKITEEDSDVLMKDRESSTTYFSEEEFIMDQIYDTFHLEIILRFMNISQKEKVKKPDLKEKQKQIPYDMAFLNEELEELFIKERLLNVNHSLFSTEAFFRKSFDSLTLEKAMRSQSLEMLERYMKEFLNKKIVKSNQNAYLGMIYITTLLGMLDEDQYDNFLEEYRNEIDDIPYNFSLVRRLKEEVSNIYVEEIDWKEENKND